MFATIRLEEDAENSNFSSGRSFSPDAQLHVLAESESSLKRSGDLWRRGSARF